jgi:8-oxo-dGTP pyrophosphatase MutT (NUDIX family)
MRNGEIRYLFLRGQNDANGKAKWSFPKGHLEYDAYHQVTDGGWTGPVPTPNAVPIECPKCCAIRETREETGITLRHDQLGYYWRGKYNGYFCVRVDRPLQVVEQEGEITGHAWATLEEQYVKENNVDVQKYIKDQLSRR